MDPIHSLTDADLRALATALRTGRLTPPFAAVGVGRIVSGPLAAELAGRLQALDGAGMRPEHIAVVAEAVLTARAGRPAADDAVELVWTGPEAAGVANRDTGVVVRELFARAERSVVVAGFAVYQGREVFRGLGERLVERPNLHARLYLDVHRPHHDATPAPDLLARFAARFVRDEWPVGLPVPEVYYDPRSLDAEQSKRSSLHAKCVVIDRQVAFVSSANFTEAAQQRNIEVGAVIRSQRFAARLADHFEALVADGLLQSVNLPSGTVRDS